MYNLWKEFRRIRSFTAACEEAQEITILNDLTEGSQMSTCGKSFAEFVRLLQHVRKHKK